MWLITLAVLLVGLAEREAGLAAALLSAALFTVYLAAQFAVRLLGPRARMRTRGTKVLLGVGGYLLVAILLLVIFGNDGKNEEFKPQDEFKLDPWLSIKVGGIDFSINRAVFYLVLASALTILVMVWISRRMQQKPNRVCSHRRAGLRPDPQQHHRQTSTSGSRPGGSLPSPPCSSSSGSPT